MSAYLRGQISRGRELMVFDWDRAARRIKEVHPKSASAGLAGDWEWTGGEIYRDGKPIPQEETYTYLASTWAKPQLEMDSQIEYCYKMQSETPDWDAKTYFPQSALDILKGVGK